MPPWHFPFPHRRTSSVPKFREVDLDFVILLARKNFICQYVLRSVIISAKKETRISLKGKQINSLSLIVARGNFPLSLADVCCLYIRLIPFFVYNSDILTHRKLQIRNTSVTAFEQTISCSCEASKCESSRIVCFVYARLDAFVSNLPLISCVVC